MRELAMQGFIPAKLSDLCQALFSRTDMCLSKPVVVTQCMCVVRINGQLWFVNLTFCLSLQILGRNWISKLACLYLHNWVEIEHYIGPAFGMWNTFRNAVGVTVCFDRLWWDSVWYNNRSIISVWCLTFVRCCCCCALNQTNTKLTHQL
jgi:hypothetical protein